MSAMSADRPQLDINCNMSTQVIYSSNTVNVISATLDVAIKKETMSPDGNFSYAWDFDEGYSFGKVSSVPITTHSYITYSTERRAWYPKVRITDMNKLLAVVNCGIVSASP